MRARFLIAVTALLLALALGATAVRADEVYVGNKPFKGPVTGAGADTYVGVEALATMLGLPVQQTEGVLVVGEGAVPAGTATGSVVVNGKVVPCKAGKDGAPMVHLKSAADALGAVMRVNKDMGTVDVTRPAKIAANTPRMGEAPPLKPAGPVIVNANNPGGPVDMRKVLVGGFFNVVYFHADW